VPTDAEHVDLGGHQRKTVTLAGGAGIVLRTAGSDGARAHVP